MAATVNYYPAASSGGAITVTAGTGLQGDGTSGTPLAGIPATTSVAGTMSATDKGYLDYLSGRWEQVQQRFQLAAIPTLTGFEYLRLGTYGLGSTIGTMTPGDAAIEGGAEACVTSNTVRCFGSSLFQTCKTGKFALSARVKMPVPASGKSNNFGLCTSAGTLRITLGPVFATDATKLVMAVEGSVAATTFVADTSWHTLSIIGDGTTITFYVDNASVGTRTAASLTANEALYFFIVGTDNLTTICSKILWGFVDP